MSEFRGGIVGVYLKTNSPTLWHGNCHSRVVVRKFKPEWLLAIATASDIAPNVGLHLDRNCGQVFTYCWNVRLGV